MKILEEFYNIDFFKVNSDNIDITSGITLKTIIIGLYKIKFKFPVVISSISDFLFTYTLGAGCSLSFQLMKADTAYWYTGGAWVIAQEDNITQSDNLSILQTNINSFITDETNFNIIIYVNVTGTTNFTITQMSFNVDSGINLISEIRQNLLEVNRKVFPDYMIKNALVTAEKIIEEILGTIIDFTIDLPEVVRLAARYMTYIEILEDIYYEQIRRGENINDITYWKEQLNVLISGIKSGSLIPGITGSSMSISNESSRQGQFFGYGIYGRPTE